MTTLDSSPGLRVRVAAFDAFRGLAVLLMLLDHVLLVTGGSDVIRHTLTRLAMPMFFLLAGYLATRPRWRHAGIGLLGLALPGLVPWLDNPNVLVLWAVGVVMLWALDRTGMPRWLLVALALTASANGWSDPSGYYEPWAMWGLMALGSMLPATAYAWAGRCPGWVAVVGRHPVGWYVGQLAVLQALVWVVAS